MKPGYTVNGLKEFREVRHIPELIYAMLPDEPQLEDGIFYVVDDSPYVEYNCPCGCGSVVMLPTKRHTDGKTGWDYIERDGKVTLSPSVFSTGLPCRSHYFIRGNRVEWCR